MFILIENNKNILLHKYDHLCTSTQINSSSVMSSKIWSKLSPKISFIVFNFKIFFFLHHDQSSQSCYALYMFLNKILGFLFCGCDCNKEQWLFPSEYSFFVKKKRISLSISYKMIVANSTEALDLSPLLLHMELTPIGGSDIVLVLFLFSLLPISLSSTYTVPFDVCCSIFTKQER